MEVTHEGRRDTRRTIKAGHEYEQADQAAVYRSISMLQQPGLWDFNAMTADSMQSKENRCIVFHILLAKAPIGERRFLKDGLPSPIYTKTIPATLTS